MIGLKTTKKRDSSYNSKNKINRNKSNNNKFKFKKDLNVVSRNVAKYLTITHL